jgi:hypothetical protein
VREFRSLGSVRGALSNERPYRDYIVWDCDSLAAGGAAEIGDVGFGLEWLDGGVGA